MACNTLNSKPDKMTFSVVSLNQGCYMLATCFSACCLCQTTRRGEVSRSKRLLSSLALWTSALFFLCGCSLFHNACWLWKACLCVCHDSWCTPWQYQSVPETRFWYLQSWDSEWWVLVSRAMMSISRTGENVDFVIQVHIFFLKD